MSSPDLPTSEFQHEWVGIRRRREQTFAGKPQLRPPQAATEGAEQSVELQPQFPPESGTSPPKEPNGEDANGQEPKNKVGLALSGGGLRSALFNEGFLQALSHRGFLRYVDYLCSVSGGGYIAGRLLTYLPQRPEAKHKPSFHHDAKDGVSDWELGRDPHSGKERDSMPQVGSYLSRSHLFAASYLLRQLPVWAMYLSLVGILASLLALLFRSYDSWMFRGLFQSLLMVQVGGELLIAFIPTIIVGVLTVMLGLVYKFCEFWSPGYHSKRRQVLGRICQCMVFATALFAFTSVAVFLGNGLTSASANADQAWNLNYFATYMAIIAGTVQILVFLGRDKLFRSERSESSHWERIAQGLVSYGVLGFLVFAMIHWMSREDISKYTGHRDPYLVVGEVLDWNHLQHIFDEVEAEIKSQERAFEIEQRSVGIKRLDFLGREQVHGLSEAQRYWRFSFADQEHAQPASPVRSEPTGLRPISPWQRLYAIAQVCLLAPFLPGDVDAPQVTPVALADLPKLPLDLAGLQQRVRAMQKAQSDYLASRNRLLQSRVLATYLVNEVVQPVRSEQTGASDGLADTTGADKRKGDSASDASGDAEEFKPRSEAVVSGSREGAEATTSEAGDPLKVKLVKGYGDEFLDLPLIRQRLSRWPENRRFAFEDALHRYTNGELFPEAAMTDGSTDSQEPLQARDLDAVKFNRDLLELVNRNLLKEYHIASTHVVQAHDQTARQRWLFVWTLLFGISLVLTANLDRLSALFIFYRSALAKNFLSRPQPGVVNGETALDQVKPEEYGLPYPIFLAAWLKLDSRFGNFVRKACAFAMTPREVRLRDGDGFAEPTRDYAQRQPLAVADAVATSGAAVTPQMTENPALAVLMDMLGMRLGLWMKLPGHQVTKSLEHRELLGLLGMLVVGFGLFLLFGIAWGILLSLIGLTWLALLANGSGYPGFLAAMLRQASLKFRKRSETEQGAIARCWPKMFIADGGFYDFLGVTELLRRRCELIVVSDAGVNTGKTTLESLARMCEAATAELGIRFLNLDHEGPIDFVRLRKNEDEYSPQPYLAMRVRYPEVDRADGLLFYAQMAIVADDPVEIQQIRYRFPSFPDEPTTNQFYTDDQVAAYRHLGYHIGNRLCRLLERWDTGSFAAEVAASAEGVTSTEDAAASEQAERFPNVQPYFSEITRRLRRGYLQTCYEEYFYDVDDVYAESVWRNRSQRTLVYPTLARTLEQMEQSAKGRDDKHQVVEDWLGKFCGNRDVMLAYMDSIDADINVTQRLREGQNEAEQSWATFEHLGRHLASAKVGHYAALAVAADQLHHGVSPRSFQVGGREKLVDLMVSLEQSFEQHDWQKMPMGFGDAVVHEVAELKDCVFQTGSHVSTVSFAQCLCQDYVGSLLGTTNEPHAFEEECAQFLQDHAGQRAHPRFDLALDFRRLFMDALVADHRSRMRDILAHYLAYLVVLPEKCPYDPGTELTFVKLAENGRSMRQQ